MKTLFLQLESGAAGDMLAAALLDLFPDPAAALAKLSALGIPGVEYKLSRGESAGLAGNRLDVLVHGEREGERDHHHDDHEHHHDHHEHHHEHHHDHHHTGMATVRERIVALAAPDKVKADVLAVYESIAEAEARAHGRPVDQIHFHEVGDLDALADIAAVSLLLSELAPDRILASVPNAGGGTVRCAHGVLPVPAPATAELLRGLPWRGDDPAAGELLTPTGAALLRHFVSAFGPNPGLCATRIGCGLGHRETPGRANLVRAFWCETETPGGPNGRVVELKANLDDMTGEALGRACERLRALPGALDVSLAPLQMKKNRPGHLLLVLAAPDAADALSAAILCETSTFGVRRTDCARYELARTVARGADGVRVKTGAGYGARKAKPEFDDL